MVAVALCALVLGAASGRAASPSLVVFAADRAPLVSGEVYRLGADGRLTDLSSSPYRDTSPVVSQDGKRVAFLSERGVATLVFEVGIDGHGLHSEGLSLSADEAPALAWQPHGHRLAVTGSPRSLRGRSALILRGVGPGRTVFTSRGGVLSPSWSPDGRVLLVRAGGAWRAFSPSGGRLWSKPSKSSCPACYARWSSRGLLAVTSQRGITVYDERGRLRFGAAAKLWSAPAWSPSGRWVAAVVGRTLQVRTATGALVLRKTLSGLGSLSAGREFGITWVGEVRVAISRVGREAREFRGVRVPSGRTWQPSSRWFQPRSADGKLAILTPPSGQDFALGVAPASGGPVDRYRGLAGCFDRSVWVPAAQSLQFVGRSRSIVYASYCMEPFSHLYSMAPDGSGLRQITSGRSYETEPMLSPDGSKIAYRSAQYTGLSCLGCPSQIRVANADGSGVRTVTNPPDGSWDLSPAWSPDGKTILFTRASTTSPNELFTVPAAGGPVHDLGIQGSQPAWGPSRIAYVQDGIWTANPDGSDPEGPSLACYLPFWSPDGTLFCTNGSAVLSGSELRLLYPFHLVTSIAWSPDQTHFLVTGRTVRADGPFDVYTIDSSGTTVLARLTRNYNATSATWR